VFSIIIGKREESRERESDIEGIPQLFFCANSNLMLVSGHDKYCRRHLVRESRERTKGGQGHLVPLTV